MSYLISATALADDLAAFKVMDCRADLMDKDLGKRQFLEAHIPEAQFANLETDLAAAPGKRGRHPLPDAEELIAKYRNWGFNNDSAIVCYDQNNGAFAARMWWLTRWLGHDQVYVLDGGLDGWLSAGFSLTSKSTNVLPGNFSKRATLTKTIEIIDIQNQQWLLTDAREPGRFRGDFEPVDPVAGHIPGALNLPFANNLIDGFFKSPEALREQFSEAFTNSKTNADSPLACYCGSGVTATHNILAMMTAGLDEPALYPGSFSEWVADPNRPVGKV